MDVYGRLLPKALKYGLIAAVLFPAVYESYANISRVFAAVILIAVCASAALGLSGFKPLHAVCGYFMYALVGLGLGAVAELMLHERVVEALEKSSVYFHLTVDEVVTFAYCTAFCYVGGGAVCLAASAARRLVRRLKQTQQPASDMIDKAFDDNETDDK